VVRRVALQAMTGGGVWVLVADNEVIRHLVSVNLDLEGFEVFTAVDGVDWLTEA